MKKADFIKAVADKADATQKEVGGILEAMIDTITSNLKKGEDVAITGFGTFKANKRAAREGRNPATGATIKIKAMRVVSFKAGKTLKDSVR